ncbi:fatty acid hydroxylase superfamily domain-containing protein [Ditylenchus destructor]|nr:fatty acid hydroxylase superfamily domain-containing protein [Ditylenchus destructor]
MDSNGTLTCWIPARGNNSRALQPAWDYLRYNFNDILRSPLFPPFFALSIDYTWVVIFTFFDLCCSEVEFFKTAKIQKDRKVTWPLIKASLKHQLYNQIVWIYPMALAQLMYVSETELPELAPTLWEITWQILTFFVIFDAGYFAFHLTCHKVRFLYRWCHSVHHMYSSPFAAAAQHLHPFELFFVGTFITTLPWAFDTHCLTYWLWFVVAQSVSYEVHTGYDFPFMLHRFVPFYAGAPAHDMHHLRPLSCFQPWLNYLDRLFGYYLSYDELKEMNREKAERYATYTEGEEDGLKKIN